MRNQPKSNNRRRPAWVEMFAKTRGGGDVADGRDWHTDVPNIKLSRAFVVVLVLHVVAVGGILAFELFKPEASVVDEHHEKDGGAAVLTADTPAPPAPEVETPAARREAERGGYESYIVQAGDSIRNVAAQYGISRTELLAANRIDEQHPLVAGRLLRIPKALLPGGSSANLVSTETNLRPNTPELSSTIEPESSAVLPVPEPLAIVEEDDGFQPLISPPVSPTPTPEPDPESSTEPEVVSTPPAYQPATVNQDEENAPVTIVAPKIEKKPKVTRSVPTDRPTQPVSTGRSHTVAAGETLYRISRRYGVSVDAILAANPGVKPSTLGIGKKLRIP